MAKKVASQSIPYEMVIDHLFNLRAALTLGSRTVYLRCLSDVDIEARDRAAMLAGRLERKILFDPESEEYQARLGYLDDLTREELIEILASIERAMQAPQVARDISPVHIPMPVGDEASVEAQADIVEKREQERRDTETVRRTELEKRVSGHRKSLEDRSTEDLLAESKRVQMSYLVNGVAARESRDQEILLAAFADPEFKFPYFPSVKEVRRLPPPIKEELRRILDEMDGVDVWTLKDLPSTER